MVLNGCTEKNVDKLKKQTNGGIQSVFNLNIQSFVTYVREKQRIPLTRGLIKYRSIQNLHKLSQNRIRAVKFLLFPSSYFIFNHCTGSVVLTELCTNRNTL